ncbi:MAG TPA: sigma-70 family RNA polymerase sigma factor [Dermatophilaceae bacterium]|nr:sigma-70 family RNA polymerase sigma factor [Dermatophilaceae bacterium]
MPYVESGAVALQAPAVAEQTPPRHQESSERERRTQELLDQAHRTADEQKRQAIWEEVVLLNTCVADAISSRYRSRGIDSDDLHQVAYLGLVKAVHGYRVGEGPGFLAYAVPTISGEIKRHFRDQGWVIRPPRRVQELRSAVSSTEHMLTQELGRGPHAAELAEVLGVEVAELREALTAEGCYSALSLDAPTRADSGQSLGDLIADEADEFAGVEVLATLRPALAALDDRERRILLLRFVRGCTQDEIGRELGVSQMQVSRLLSAILARLRLRLSQPAE